MANDSPSLEAEVAGQKFSMKGFKDPNTLFTIATFIGVAILGTWMYAHLQDARDASANFVAAIKEQTAAVREQTVAAKEQNCLMRFETKDRAQYAEFCKTIAR